MAADFLAAILEWWGSNADLAAAGIGELHFGTGGDADYPYVVLTKVGGNVAGLNTGPGYWEKDYWRFAIFSDDQDQAVALAAAASAALDTILRNPLTFANGYQMTFYRAGSDVRKLRREGTDGSPIVWEYSLTYMSKVGRTRP